MKWNKTVKVMNRTTTLGILMISLAFGIASCGKTTNHAESTDIEQVRMALPDSLGMSRDTLQNRVAELSRKELAIQEHELVEEAISAIAQTRQALEAIANQDKEEALKQLESAIGKLEVLLARDPELVEVPISVDARQVELITDLEGVKKLKKAVKEAIKEDQYQAARQLLEGMASEAVITITKIPLGAYPDAMRLAVSFLDKDNFEMAALTIGEALKALVVKEIIVPLPILRAEVLLQQAQSLLTHKEQKATILTLLENAQYQLILAEEMGYGRRDKEFVTLAKAIKEIRRGINEGQDVIQPMDTLLNTLRKFKDRIIHNQ